MLIYAIFYLLSQIIGVNRPIDGVGFPITPHVKSKSKIDWVQVKEVV